MEHENKIKKVLFNEISFAIASIGLISSFIFWIINPQQDLQIEIVKLQAKIETSETVTVALEKIKNNDLHEIQLRLDKIEDRQIETLKAVARLEALLIRR